MTFTVYVSIGNSDDRLSQRRWSAFVHDVEHAIRADGDAVFGSWRSSSDEPYQNACWAFSIPAARAPHLREWLAQLAEKYEQDSIAWAEVAVTHFLGPKGDANRGQWAGER